MPAAPSDDSKSASSRMMFADLPPSSCATRLTVGVAAGGLILAGAALSRYPWRSVEGRQAYEQIQDLLRREVLDSSFASMKQALES